MLIIWQLNVPLTHGSFFHWFVAKSIYCKMFLKAIFFVNFPLLCFMIIRFVSISICLFWVPLLWDLVTIFHSENCRILFVDSFLLNWPAVKLFFIALTFSQWFWLWAGFSGFSVLTFYFLFFHSKANLPKC